MKFEKVSDTRVRVLGRGYVFGYILYKEPLNKAVIALDCEDAHLDADTLLAIAYQIRQLEEAHGS
jgi:hypothetical protein